MVIMIGFGQTVIGEISSKLRCHQKPRDKSYCAIEKYEKRRRTEKAEKLVWEVDRRSIYLPLLNTASHTRGDDGKKFYFFNQCQFN